MRASQDPISCEVLSMPVTLHCGHTFSKRSLTSLLQVSGLRTEEHETAGLDMMATIAQLLQ